jgi:ubiquinone/menaquinone biosynthesis C-methylase UbiE
MLPRWFIRLGFHLLYYQMAWTYDFIAWLVSFGQWAAWRRLALQFLQPGPTLELAFGTGGLFVDLMEGGYRPIGIDLSPYMARLASRRLRAKGLAIPLNQAKAQALPFPSGHFANVIATFPTNYMFDPATLAEIRRVLKPVQNGGTGQLIIVVQGHLRGPWPLRSVIDWLYQITGQQDFPDVKPIHVFAQHHFDAHWENIEVEGASARLLVARKQSELGT